MKKVLILFAIVAAVVSLTPCEAQLTTNVLRRVLLLKTPAGTGTAFTIEVDGRQYLITAKHIVSGLKEDDTIQIRKGEQWAPLAVKILRCDDPVDIAVLVAPSQLTVSFPLEATSDGLSVGQDSFFVGFPYGLQSDFKGYNGAYQLGLAKRATVSAFEPVPENKGMVILLDGYNNPGFSGSPVVFRDLRQGGLVYRVAGVVVSFRFEVAPVLKTEEVRQEQVTMDDRTQSRIVEYHGRLFRVVRETTDFVKLNTGIATAYDIRSAVTLIHQHPIGPKVVDDFDKTNPN